MSSAQFLKEKPEESPVEPPAKKPAPEPASANDGSAPAAQEGAPAAESAAPAASPPAADAAGAGEKKRKKMVRADLIVKARLPGMSDAELGQAVEEEARMARQDRIMEETANKRNELEAYMYALRDKLAGELSAFATDAEKQAYTSKYEEMEDWLYSEEVRRARPAPCPCPHTCAAHPGAALQADNATKAVLAGKLGELQAIGNPVQQRLTESQERPAASSALLAATERFKMLVNTSVRFPRACTHTRCTQPRPSPPPAALAFAGGPGAPDRRGAQHGAAGVPGRGALDLGHDGRAGAEAAHRGAGAACQRHSHSPGGGGVALQAHREQAQAQAQGGEEGGEGGGQAG